MGNLSNPMLGTTLEAGLCPPPAPSASMSFSWLFLGGLLSSTARLRFTNRGQGAVHSFCPSRIFQRTANTVLFDCLSGGVHPTPFEAVFGHLPDLVLTRVERQFRRIPANLRTLGSAFRSCAEIDPFDTLILVPTGMAFSRPAPGTNITLWLQALGLRFLVNALGRQATRRLVNRHSRGNAHRLLGRLERVLPARAEPQATVEQLTQIYRNGVRQQLFGSEVAEPLQGRFPPS